MDKEQELRLLLKCSVLEHELRINKTNYYFNCKLEAEQALAKTPKTKVFAKIRRDISDSIIDFKKRIFRAEKYNSEMLDCFLKHGGSNRLLYESVIENSTDLYDDLTQTFLKSLSDIKPGEKKNLRVVLLEESENGNLFFENNRYKILSK